MTDSFAADADKLLHSLSDTRKTVVLSHGETIGYTEQGNTDAEKTLLLIHGILTNATSLDAVRDLPEVQAALKEGNWRVVSAEMRGCGRSSYNERLQSHEDNGRDMVALLDALKVRKVLAFGFSTGGPVALEVASGVGPERALGVVLYGSVGLEGCVVDAEKPYPPEPRKSREEADASSASLAAMIASRNVAKVEATFNSAVRPVRDAMDLAQVCRAVFEQRESNVQDNVWCNLSYNGRDKALGLKCPFLTLHGEADVLIPAVHARACHQRLKDAGVASELVVVSKATHHVVAAGAREVGEALAALIRRV